MIKFGFLIKSLGTSQHSLFLISQMNAICDLRADLDVLLFYEHYNNIPILPYVGMLQQREVWGFDAPVCATDFSSAQKLVNCPRPRPKYYYVWDLEWIYMDGVSYEDYKKVFHNDDLTLIARSKEHADIITRCWKEPKYIIPDFDKDKFLELMVKQ